MPLKIDNLKIEIIFYKQKEFNESREIMNRLHGQQVKIGYGDNTIINKLDVEIPDGKVTSIIAYNGCGKSTLLKALSRLLAVKEGEVFLDGENIDHNLRKRLQKNSYFTSIT